MRQKTATRDLLDVHAQVQCERHLREEAELRWRRIASDLRDSRQQSLHLAARLDQAYLETIARLARAVEARDHGTGNHVERVRVLSVFIAERMGISGDERQRLEFGALLHDIGKLGIPDTILTKQGPLSGAEWTVMRTHPLVGRRVLQGIEFLGSALDAVVTHHERLAGSGYPHGLRGEEIPLMGRSVAVADAFDAMTSDRPYRTGLHPAVAREEIYRQRRVQFCPRVVDAFLEYPQALARSVA